MSKTAQSYARPPSVPVATRVPFAFVHVNKCGGSGIEMVLGIPKTHQTAAEMRAEMGAEEWDRRFTFAVVRNPFDRIVSIYYYRVRTNQTGLGDRHLNVNGWVGRVFGDRDPAYRAGAPSLLAPSADWVTADGALIVDRVLRLETLDRDWPDIAGVLGVSGHPGHTNWNHHPPYRDVLNAESRALLETAFRSDLDRFDYAY